MRGPAGIEANEDAVSTMNEHQIETAFPRQCLCYDDGAERQELEKKIAWIQRDARTLQRATRLMAVLNGLAIAGLGYSAVFLQDLPDRMSEFVTQYVVKGCFSLGIGSLLSLLVFAGLGAIYRQELDQRRGECRRAVMKLLESRLGRPGATAVQNSRADSVAGEAAQGTIEVRASPVGTKPVASY